jgi:ZIP family zinc transporter
MPYEVLAGLLIPFAGTTLGSALVFFMRDQLSTEVERALTGFAAGVMVAASVWSLLVPAMEASEASGSERSFSWRLTT